ncbi:MAG: tRNA threonylcarbamoyladenosine dehydratase [Erysipelotrichaceae bacterium]
MKNEALERIELLIGQQGIDILAQSSVLVLGCGGVGSYAIESLARCGVGTLILVDADTVAVSNLNRQIPATYATIGQLKTEAMKERILSYAPQCNVICINSFYDASKNELIFAHQIDYVIDAIDTLSSKVDVIAYCKRNKIPFISSMGMANRWDVTRVQIVDLSKTFNDPLSKVMRRMVKERGIKGKIPVLFSDELPFKQHIIVNENGITRKMQQPPASTPFVPAAAGLAAASLAVRTLLAKK